MASGEGGDDKVGKKGEVSGEERRCWQGGRGGGRQRGGV